MKFKAVIFDLDGTLLDSVEDLADAMNHVLRHLGMPEHDLTAYRRFVGEGIEPLVRKALPAGEGEESLLRAVSHMTLEYAERCLVKTRPYEGIPELLDLLSSRRIDMSVLSNKSDPFTRKMVASLLPGWTFRAVIGSRPLIPRKPDPSGAQEIAALLGIPPEEILYLGDTRIDMETACAANMYAAGVLWGFRDSPELLEGGARILIRQPADLYPWF